MKKLPLSHREKLNQSKFYLDDIENIVEIFREASGEVRIETKGYALDSVQELANLGSETINDLKISIQHPHVKLELQNFIIELYIGDDSPLSRGIFEKVKAIVNKKNKSFISTLRNSAFGVGLSSAFLFLGVIAAFQQSWSLVTLALIAAITCAFWARWAWNEHFGRYSIIMLKKQAEHKSFVERNKDQIILIIVSGLVGAIITYILTELTR